MSAADPDAPTRRIESGFPGTRRRALAAGRIVVGLVSLLVLTGTGVAATVLSRLTGGLNTSDALGTDAPKSLGGDVNLLLIGLDSRKDQDGNQLPAEVLDQLHAGDGTQGGYNTNTLILMHIPGNGGKVSAVSIPRDDYVAVQGIPGYTHAKIKEAYGLAKFRAEQDLVEQGVTDKAELEHKGREAGRRGLPGRPPNARRCPGTGVRAATARLGKWSSRPRPPAAGGPVLRSAQALHRRNVHRPGQAARG